MTATSIRSPLFARNRIRIRVAPMEHPQQDEKHMLAKPQQTFAIARSTSFLDDDKVDFSTTAETREDIEEYDISVFRRQWESHSENQEDMWTLKRANPICDEDECEEQTPYESPSKRSRTSTLQWNEKLLLQDEPLLISASSLLYDSSSE
jgi:hypothetical protein